MTKFKPNTLYLGDCLEVMSRWEDKCVDLIYLDPPFNTNIQWKVGASSRFRAVDPRSDLSEVPLVFSDSFKWNDSTAKRLQDIYSGYGLHRNIMGGLETVCGRSGTLAYLIFIADRLNEMHRIMKDTASIYFHINPAEVHYVKILMDGIFGRDKFKNDISWRRSLGPTQSSKKYFVQHDCILFYCKGDRFNI